MSYYRINDKAGKLQMLSEGSSSHEIEREILLQQAKGNLKSLGLDFKIEAVSQDEITDIHNLKSRQQFQRLGLSESKAEIAANGRSDRKFVESETFIRVRGLNRSDKKIPEREKGQMVFNTVTDDRDQKRNQKRERENMKDSENPDPKQDPLFEDFKRMGMTDKGAALAAVGRNS